MPLLSRHKSNASPPVVTGAGNNQQASQQGTGSRQQLCESPLFGTRRQLPTGAFDETNGNIATVVSQQQTGSGNKQQQPLSANSAGLSSIPQQITRQQIHYAFTIMDSNKDGQVDVRDLSQMLSNLGIPIDEAILSHIMTNTVSKRGDHRISESEFLDWISHFIQIRAESPPGRGGQRDARPSSGRTAVRVTRSSTASSSLVAQPSESITRNRRGSGSGLALMRSLSSSSAAPSSTSKPETVSLSCERISRSSPKVSSLQHQSSVESVMEAKNDLKAAFCVFDLDGDGYITLDEVRAGLKLLGESWSPVELRRLFSKCNSNTNQTDLTKQRISIDDFVQLLL